MSKKKVEFKNMHENELRAHLAESREALFKMKFQNATAPIKNPHEISRVRRDVARSMTFLRQMELKKEAGAKA
jgi:large subunit ribosomal protein L29